MLGLREKKQKEAQKMKRYKDTNYSITEDGKVFNHKFNRFLSSKTKSKYTKVCLFHKGEKSYKSVHRLVAECYIPNPNNYGYVNHINNNTLDNNVENLEWCSVQMNIDHMVNQNRNSKGISRPLSKVTENDVIEIRRIYANKELSTIKLGIKYNMSTSSIWYIVKRKTWKHI